MREDWKEVRVKDICDIKGRIGYRGYTVDDLVSEGEGAITLSPSNMQNGKMVYDSCSYITWEKYEQSPEIKVKVGDVLFVKTGSTFGKSIRVDYLPMPATINPQICILSPYQSYKYLAYIFQSEYVSILVNTSVIGGTIPTISQTKVGNFNIVIPPLPEQHAIANYLDKKLSVIDKHISLLENKRDTYKRLRKNLINQTVRRGLSPLSFGEGQGERLQDSEIEWLGKIPKHWEVKRLKDYRLNYFTGFTPEVDTFLQSDGDTTWVTIADMQEKIITNSKIDILAETANKKGQPITPKGSLLFSFKLSIGKVGFAGKDLYTNEAIVSILPTNKINFNYFYYVLPIVIFENATENIYGAKMLNQKIINNMLFAIPPLSEQQAIADYLDAQTQKIDNILENINGQLGKLAQLKKSLINETVTGNRNITTGDTNIA